MVKLQTSKHTNHLSLLYQDLEQSNIEALNAQLSHGLFPTLLTSKVANSLWKTSKAQPQQKKNTLDLKKQSLSSFTTQKSKSFKQGDLIEWGKTFIKKKVRKLKCLDCNKVELTLKFSEESGIFEGKRICRSCIQLQKRRHLGGW